MYPTWITPVNGNIWCSHMEWILIFFTITISLWLSSENIALLRTSSAVREYPDVMKSNALAQRSGVFNNPSRSGSSPIHFSMVLHADVICSSLSLSVLVFLTSPWHVVSEEDSSRDGFVVVVRLLFLDSSNHKRSSSKESELSILLSTESSSLFGDDEPEVVDETSAGVWYCMAMVKGCCLCEVHTSINRWGEGQTFFWVMSAKNLRLQSKNHKRKDRYISSRR